MPARDPEIESIRPGNPYKGLEPFSEQDYAFFFGRETESEIIEVNLRTSRLTLLYGPTGAGKTSVLRAGVVRSIQAEAADRREYGEAPRSAVVIFDAWHDDPLPGLKSAIRSAVREAFVFPTGARRATIAGNAFAARPDREAMVSADSGGASDPAESAHSLHETLTTGVRALDPDGAGELFVILDQFEQYFLNHEVTWATDSFPAELARAVNDLNLTANFLIAIRDDWLARMDGFRGFIDGLFDNTLSIDYLDRDAAQRAIVGPIDRYNELLPAGEDPITCSCGDDEIDAEKKRQAFVTAVLGDENLLHGIEMNAGSQGAAASTADADDDRRVATPFLQLVLTRLWEEDVVVGQGRTLRCATFARLGRAHGIIRSHVERVVRNLEPRERHIACRIAPLLLGVDGTKIAAAAADLAERINRPAEEIEHVVRKLSSDAFRRRGRSLLRPVNPPPRRPNVRRYEFLHDVLGQAVVKWSEEEKARIRKRRLEKKVRKDERAARRIQEAEQRIIRQKRKQKIFWLTSLILVLLSVGALLLLVDQTRQRTETTARLSLALSQASGDAQALFARQAYRFRTQPNWWSRSEPRLHADRLEDLDLRIIASLHEALSIHVATFLYQDGNSPVLSAGFNLDGTKLASVDEFGNVYERAWPPNAEAIAPSVRRLSLGMQAQSVADISSDHSLVGFGDASGYGEYRNLVDTSVTPVGGYVTTDYSGVTSVAVAAAEELFAVVGLDGIATLYDNLEITLSEPRVSVVAFSPDGSILALGSVDGGISQVDVRTAPVTSLDHRALTSNRGPIASLAVTDSGAVGFGTEEGWIAYWNPATADLKERYEFSGPVSAVALGPGAMLAASGAAGRVVVWMMGASSEGSTYELGGFSAAVAGLAFSSDGRWLAASCRDGTVRVWDVERLILESTVIRSHGDRIGDMALSPDGRRLATAGVSDVSSSFAWGTPYEGHLPIKLWDTERWTSRALPLGAPLVRSVAYHPKDTLLAVGLENGSVQLIDEEGIVLNTLWAPRSRNAPLDESAVKRSIDERRDSLATLPLEAPRDTMIGAATAVEFSADGRLLAVGYAGNAGGDVRLYEKKEERWQSSALPSTGGSITEISFSDDGAIAAATWGGKIYVWKRDEHSWQAAIRPGYGDALLSVAFGPDGQLAAGDAAGRVLYWARPDDAIYMEPRILSAHAEGVRAVAFNSTGGLLASGGDDKVVRLWNLASDTDEPLELRGHTDWIFVLTFDAESEKLISGGDDGTLRLWSLNLQELADRVCNVVHRNLTLKEWRQIAGADRPYERTCETHPVHPSVLETARGKARSGDAAGARTLFDWALRADPRLAETIDASAEIRSARSAALVESSINRALADDIAGSIALFRRTVAQDPDRSRDTTRFAVALLAAAEQAAQRLEIEKSFAVSDSAHSFDQRLNPTADHYNRLCWYGGLAGKAELEEVYDACQKAVELAGGMSYPGYIFDSRGLILALRGDLEGAARDFAVFVNEYSPGREQRQRARWIVDLQQGRNPITTDTLAALYINE